MTTVDITADLNDEDDTGYVWTFLDEARDPSVIAPGAIVVAGTPDAQDRPSPWSSTSSPSRPAPSCTCASSPGRSATTPPRSYAPPHRPDLPPGGASRPWRATASPDSRSPARRPCRSTVKPTDPYQPLPVDPVENPVEIRRHKRGEIVLRIGTRRTKPKLLTRLGPGQ